MLEEAPVLDRQHGIAQHLGNVVEVYGAAFLAGIVEQAGQQFRLDFNRIQRAPVSIERIFWISLPLKSHHDAVFLAEVGFARRPNFNFIAVQDVAPRSPGNIQFAVAGALQVIRELSDGEGLAGGDPHRSGVNSGRGLLDMPGKTLVNHPAVGNPVIRRHSGDNEEKKKRRPKKSQAKPGYPKTPADSNSQRSSPFRRTIKSGTRWVP